MHISRKRCVMKITDPCQWWWIEWPDCQFSRTETNTTTRPVRTLYIRILWIVLARLSWLPSWTILQLQETLMDSHWDSPDRIRVSWKVQSHHSCRTRAPWHVGSRYWHRGEHTVSKQLSLLYYPDAVPYHHHHAGSSPLHDATGHIIFQSSYYCENFQFANNAGSSTRLHSWPIALSLIYMNEKTTTNDSIFWGYSVD